MKSEDFIDYAERLYLQPTAIPPQVRSITSRAYYGAFHLAVRVIESLTHVSRGKHDAHVWLTASRHPDAYEAGKLLGILCSYRIKADYRLEDTAAELPATARLTVEHARDVQRLILRCASAPPAEVLARR